MTTPKKKPITDLPTEEAIRKLFPKKVVEEAKREAHKKDDQPKGNTHPKDTLA